jgi:carbon monoxide dehydrogenase subunit G
MAKPKMHPESASRKPLTAGRLRELLHYDPETGVFTRDGRQVGTPHGTGYIVLRVDGANYYAHRLAWLYVKGEWPVGFIDHRDRFRGNNRFANLRDSSNGQNLRNRGATKANTSGFKGVSRHRNRWRATIKAGGKQINLGHHKTKELAAAAYAEAAKRLHGEFSFVPPRREGG